MNTTTTSACYHCCARKRLENRCCGFFLNYYPIPSFEEIVEIFDNWLIKSGKNFVKLDTVIKFFIEMHNHQNYFIELSKIPFKSQQQQQRLFPCDNNLPKNANLQFFEMILSENYLSQADEIQMLIDSIAHVILTNQISEFKISSICKFCAMIGNYLVGCEHLHKHGLEFLSNDVC